MSSIETLIGSYEKEARALLQSVEDIEFSGTTYQVQIAEEFWPFIQFDPEGQIKDAFCTCESESESCVHIAAAILAIFNRLSEPLHVRFEKSLWNVLCEIYAARQGYDVDILTKVGEGHYALDTVSHKRLFGVEAQGGDWLETMIECRVRETEQNSLKFSGLSHEQLTLWREGRPSPSLRYELSFWSDLAKRMMMMQEQGGDYTIDYSYASTGLPNEIRIRFADFQAHFYLSEANLPLVIPALATVNSPLAVHHLQVEQVRYDKVSGNLHIVSKQMEEEVQQEGAVHFDTWLFVPQQGFYSREQHTLLNRPTIPAEELGEVLTQHTNTLANYLTIHEERVRPGYHLRFDGNWDLHITSFLFDEGDLQSGYARLFDGWVYLDDDGFYRLEHRQFDDIVKVIPESEVSNFVHRHRVWLNSQEGFHTHLTSVESQLSYRLTDDNTLILEGQVEMPEGKDFGEWVYIEGQGFYSKARGRSGSPVRAGTQVACDDIPLFLQVNRDELELIGNFFSTSCPVIKGSLVLTVNARGHVLVKPTYELDPSYSHRDIRFFDEFVFVEDEGFSSIPPELRLPERFREPVTLKGEELRLFLNYELEALKPHIASLDRRLQHADLLNVSLRDAKMVAGQVRLHLVYSSQHGHVPVCQVWQALDKRRGHLLSEAGLIDLSHPRFAWLRQVPADRVNIADNEIRLTALEFIRFNVLEEPSVEAGTPSAELVNTFTTLEPAELPNTAGLRSELRPYQAVGVRWLWFLYQNSLSGLLCDDMGLGKTHEAMALLAAVMNAKAERGYYLIVCPASVIYHWKEKLAQFLPDVNVYTFYGTHRTLKNLGSHDILLTSYGILRSERARLAKLPFEVAIYDEIQVAKNASSQTHAALSLVQARMRLGLTGTPIENHLGELKALFDLVLPTYFPSHQQFRESFILPIERDRDEGRKALLRRIIRPFILRRKKEEVLTDLPDKTEEKSHCDLTPTQRRLYNETLLQSKERLIRELENEASPAPYMHVFALLTALKQICDHPAVHYKDPMGYKMHDSGKWHLFIELLSQARQSRQKVVVFSQYLAMLDIIEAYLKEMDIGYASIRGSTGDRETPLKRFRDDPTCEVFVGSLQAVGLGVDLTAASVVIHYDRWWNAARENQATDRVHRIGQTRGVQVFKLITLNSCEERIDEIIEKKGRQMEEVIGSEQSQLKSFTRDELISLLLLASEPG